MKTVFFSFIFLFSFFIASGIVSAQAQGQGQSEPTSPPIVAVTNSQTFHDGDIINVKAGQTIFFYAIEGFELNPSEITIEKPGVYALKLNDNEPKVIEVSEQK